ncbi:unnamed protein product [Chrysoparadoxa australica]
MTLLALQGIGDDELNQLPAHAETRTWEGELESLACSQACSFALVKEREQRTIYGWGTGLAGELLPGEGRSIKREERVVLVPKALALAAEVTLIACGSYHVIAATKRGGALAWGAGGREDILGTKPCGGTGCLSCSNKSCGDKDKGGLWVMGLENEELASVAAGSSHSLVVTTQGKVYAWGDGRSGQLGAKECYQSPLVRSNKDSLHCCCRPLLVETPQDASGSPIKACCGKDFCALLTSKGEVITFGNGLYGQLGHGTSENESTPQVVKALLGVGSMTSAGSFTGVTSVACGAWHTIAATSAGDVYGFGWGKFGQLGIAREEGEGEIESTPRLLEEHLLSSALGGLAVAEVHCGARCSMAVSAGGKSAAVWGQVSPAHDYGPLPVPLHPASKPQPKHSSTSLSPISMKGVLKWVGTGPWHAVLGLWEPP